MSFNENSRVKIPAILHLCRLGYEYLSLRGASRDESTNIFTDIFSGSISRINPDLEESDIKRLLEDVSLKLGYEDLGEEFYRMLTARTGVKLLDFTDFSNNSLHVVTELPCKNGDDEFRPDITLLINGMPLAFVEVKKPNNQEGVLAERDRMNSRFRNKKFRKFINISQILVFSNNMEYDQESIEPVQGAFYATTSRGDVSFNCFREEETFDLLQLLLPEDDDRENRVLKDNNLAAIKHSPEFITNKEPTATTNRLLTSLFSSERLRLSHFGMKVKSGSGDGKCHEEHHVQQPDPLLVPMHEGSDADEHPDDAEHNRNEGKGFLAEDAPVLKDCFNRKKKKSNGDEYYEQPVEREFSEHWLSFKTISCRGLSNKSPSHVLI